MKTTNETQRFWDEGQMSPDFVREMDLEDDYPELFSLSELANGIFELLEIVRQHQEKGWDDDPMLQSLLRGISTLTIPDLPFALETLGEFYQSLVNNFHLLQHMDGESAVEFEDGK